MNKWQKVFETDSPSRVELVKAVLEEEGMNPIVINKRDSSYNNFGYYEIHVSPDHVIKAIKKISDEVSFE